MRLLMLGTLLVISANAYSAVIDFENVPMGESVLALSPEEIYLDGMHFQALSGYISGMSVFREGYSAAFGRAPLGEIALLGKGILSSYGVGYVDPWISMERADGSTFSLNSFVAGTDDVFSIISSGGLTLSVNGNNPNFNPLSGVEIGNGLTRYYLPSDWVNLTSVTWRHTSSDDSSLAVFMLDDITVNSAFVPVPGAVWLLGSGLGILGWFRAEKAAE